MILTKLVIRISCPVVDDNESGLLDTSVVIDLGVISREKLPKRIAISAVTLAELAAGPAASKDPDIRARRQEQLQRAESTFNPIPLDVNVARAYGRIVGAVVAAKRKHRGARSLDLLIAATALANQIPLYTRNPDDFIGLESLIDVIAI